MTLHPEHPHREHPSPEASPPKEASRSSPTAGDPARHEDLRRLLKRPLRGRLALLRRDRRLQRPDLCRSLLERARQAVFDDPAAALEDARCAHGLAEVLGDPRLRFSAALELANARRVTGELEEAASELRAAAALLAELGHEPLLTGRLHHLEASLAKDRGDVPRALERSERSLVQFRRAGAGTWECEALVKRGVILLHADRPSDGLRCLRRALPLLRPDRDRRLSVICLQNLVVGLNDLGYSIAARSLLGRLQVLHRRLGDRVNLLRYRWLEGSILTELDRLDLAEATLREAHQGFLDLNLPYDAALVSLHLAEVLLRDGRPRELQRLALAMMPIFQSRHIHREALAALIFFREAISLHQADLELVQRLSSFLERARHDRTLRFRQRPDGEREP